MKRILITGAAGFIGRNLANQLRTKGYAVSTSDKSGEGIRDDHVALDILDYAALARHVGDRQPEVVFHMAARTDLLGSEIGDYRANTDGVRNIIAACKACSSVKRVIFASSRMVCRIDHVPEGYEDYSPPNAYGASKVEGERIVRGSETPFEWVIVRPTSIWGPGFGIPYRVFFDQVRRRRYFHQRGQNPRKSFGFVGNTVYQLEQLIEASTSKVNRRVFYLGDYEPLAVRDWANYIHGLFGLRGRIPTIPLTVLRAAAKSGDMLNWITAKDKAPLTTFRLNNLLTPMVYPQLRELEAVTGPLPFDWRIGTEKTVEWMKNE